MRDNSKKDKNDKRDKNDKQEAKFVLLDVALYIHNFRGTRTPCASGSSCNTPGSTSSWSGTEWSSPRKSAEDPDRFIDFFKDGRDVLVELSTGEIIGFNTPDFGFPTIRIWIGQITTSEMKIEQTLLDTGMAENKTLFVPRMMVSRLNDTGTHKQFQVDLL